MREYTPTPTTAHINVRIHTKIHMHTRTHTHLWEKEIESMFEAEVREVGVRR